MARRLRSVRRALDVYASRLVLWKRSDWEQNFQPAEPAFTADLVMRIQTPSVAHRKMTMIPPFTTEAVFVMLRTAPMSIKPVHDNLPLRQRVPLRMDGTFRASHEVEKAVLDEEEKPMFCLHPRTSTSLAGSLCQVNAPRVLPHFLYLYFFVPRIAGSSSSPPPRPWMRDPSTQTTNTS